MRLLKRNDDGSLSFSMVTKDTAVVKYAILSHTWGAPEQEILFEDINSGKAQEKTAYTKVDFALSQAHLDKLDYVWIDTCCINKKDTHELEKSINSMYKWYAGAEVCYVYLSDIALRPSGGLADGQWTTAFQKSRWFTRGWTLQELVAPGKVMFFTKDRQPIGTRETLSMVIGSVTGINRKVLQGATLADIPIDERFRWSLGRSTGEPEDMIYCMLGMLDVSIYLKYGEGLDVARKRLFREIKREYGSRTCGLLQDMRFTGTASIPSLMPPGLKPIKDASWLRDALSYRNMFARKTAIRQPVRKTCAWLLEHLYYRSWSSIASDEDHPGMLWIKGHPGAGKSTLLMYADQQAAQSLPADTLLISFFFNARGEDMEKSAVGMYRSLLVQLADVVPGKVNAVLAERSPDLEADHIRNSIPELQKIFKAIVLRLAPSRLRCYVDALDECESHEVQDLLDFFNDLTYISSSSQRPFIVCVASRYYPAVSIKQSVEIRIDRQPQHLEDLERFVDATLNVGTGRSSLSIRQKIVAKAKGSFIWARLVIELLNDKLKHGDTSSVQLVIDTLPSKLNDLYKEIIRVHRLAETEVVRVCIICIMFATRPLRPQELYHIAQIAKQGLQHICDHTDTSIPVAELPDEDMLRRFVASSTGGLAEVIWDDYDAVQFIHESVKDYLRTTDNLQDLLMITAQQDPVSMCHEQIKAMCQVIIGNAFSSAFVAISLSRFSDVWKHNEEAVEYGYLCDRSQDPGSFWTLMMKLPLLEYAASNIVIHAELAAQEIAQDGFMDHMHAGFLLQLRKFLRNARPFPFERMAQRMGIGNIGSIHIAACFDAVNLLTTALRNGHDVNLRNVDNITPLMAAVACNAWKSANLLLQHKADVNMVNCDGESALHIAASYFPLVSGPSYHAGVLFMRALLSNGPCIEAKNSMGWTPLMIAIRVGQELYVEALLEAGACVNTRANEGITPLMQASLMLQDNIVHQLIDAGANVNLVDAQGWSALRYVLDLSHNKCYFASSDPGVCIHQVVVKALLAASVDVKCKDQLQQSPLDVISSSEWRREWSSFECRKRIRQWIESASTPSECRTRRTLKRQKR
ncbi:hypothetical protein AMS68_003789 [Peltaster fructicola]|uniref:Uncharacterized protein n=1 Tax=Peltaster fructicola TaxID=286661 RepID=A0A6H0XU20_9PEZI|nr:hypothetical protein AMS68_003789 [Peltaster fructicola]